MVADQEIPCATSKEPETDMQLPPVSADVQPQYLHRQLSLLVLG